VIFSLNKSVSRPGQIRWNTGQPTDTLEHFIAKFIDSTFMEVGSLQENSMAYLKEIELKYKITEVDSDVIGSGASSSAQVYRLFQDLQNETKEKFITLNLDSHDKILCFEVVAIGSVKSIHARPMEVFRTSIMVNAASAIVIHNHPSGDPEPSQSDIQFTQKLVNLSTEMGLKLWDHVIIGTGRYHSFADSGLLDELRKAR
jgi:DNA repair protein RadC